MLGAILGLGGAGGLASKVGQGGPMIGSADRSPIGNMLDTVGAGDILNMKKPQPSYQERAQNFSGHEAMDLKTREELIRRGVPQNTPNMPMMDATHAGAVRVMRERDNAARSAPSLQDEQDQMLGMTGMSQQERARLDARARAAGYPSYAAMALRQQQLDRNRNNNSQVSGDEKSLWDNAMAWHPKNLLEYVNEKLRGATGR